VRVLGPGGVIGINLFPEPPEAQDLAFGLSGGNAEVLEKAWRSKTWCVWSTFGVVGRWPGVVRNVAASGGCGCVWSCFEERRLGQL